MTIAVHIDLCGRGRPWRGVEQSMDLPRLACGNRCVPPALWTSRLRRRTTVPRTAERSGGTPRTNRWSSRIRGWAGPSAGSTSSRSRCAIDEARGDAAADTGTDWKDHLARSLDYRRWLRLFLEYRPGQGSAWLAFDAARTRRSRVWRRSSCSQPLPHCVDQPRHRHDVSGAQEQHCQHRPLAQALHWYRHAVGHNLKRTQNSAARGGCSVCGRLRQRLPQRTENPDTASCSPVAFPEGVASKADGVALSPALGHTHSSQSLW